MKVIFVENVKRGGKSKMRQAHKDVIEFYNKIIKARKRITIFKNPNNRNVKIFIDKKFLGEFSEEELKNRRQI